MIYIIYFSVLCVVVPLAVGGFGWLLAKDKGFMWGLVAGVVISVLYFINTGGCCM